MLRCAPGALPDCGLCAGEGRCSYGDRMRVEAVRPVLASGQLLSEVTKMKKVYEGIAGFVRWLLAGIFSFIIVWPSWVSLTYEI